MSLHNADWFSFVGGNTHSSEGLTVRMPDLVGPPLEVDTNGTTIVIRPDGSITVTRSGSTILDLVYNVDLDKYVLNESFTVG